MANLWITQYATQGRDDRGFVAAPEEPNLGTIKMTGIAAGNTVSGVALDPKTRMVRLYGDAQMAVSFGGTPDATADAIAVPLAASTPEVFALAVQVVRPGTLKVAAATI